MGPVKYASASVVALLAAFIYARWSILPFFFVNAPARLSSVNAIGDYEVRFKDVVRNCEDIYLNENEGWALLSCDPGRDKWNTVMVGPYGPILHLLLC